MLAASSRKHIAIWPARERPSTRPEMHVMNFAFKGRNGRGELVEGIVDALNSDAVAAQLMAGGVVPVSIEATSEAVSVAGGGNWLEALLAKPSPRKTRWC